MSPSPWLFTALSVLLTAAAHLVFKLYATGGGWALLATTIALFLAIPVSTFMALRELTLAQVYLCTAAVPVISLVVARVVFNESIRRSHVWSTALIVVGIVLYQSAGVT